MSITPDPTLALGLSLVAHASSRRAALGLSPYQALAACAMSLRGPCLEVLPQMPLASIRCRHVLMLNVPSTAAAMELRPRYPMLAIGPWVLSLSGQEGYDEILRSNNATDPGKPMTWTDSVYDHEGQDVLRELGSRAPAFFSLLEELSSIAQQWSLEQATPAVSSGTTSPGMRL